MALFHKKPDIGTSAPLYTLGLNKTILLVGLGNPGKKYGGTRHNVGFECLDFMRDQQDWPNWVEKKDLKCHFSSTNVGNTRVIAIKPTTYMNKSGEAVQLVCHFYKIQPANVIVVHDELDLPFGEIRSRSGGSSAGHNGIASLIEHIGENFGRIRVGVANPKSAVLDSADFVLAKFDKNEQAEATDLRKEVASLVIQAIADGSVTPQTTKWLI